MVNGQTVGCADIFVNDGDHVGTCQRSSHDAGVLFIPVGPEHQAGGEKKTNYRRKVLRKLKERKASPLGGERWFLLDLQLLAYSLHPY